MKDTRITGKTGKTARVPFHMIVEKTEIKPITSSDKRAGKDRGKLGY